MIIYSGNKSDFIAQQSQLPDILKRNVLERLGEDTSDNEYLSWQNSLAFMRRLMESPSIPDDAGMALEHNIPVTNSRIVLFFPGWSEYVDRDDVLGSLRMEDADRFETLRIECGFDDANEEMKASEGDYIIEDFEQQKALDENDEVMIVGIDNPKDQIMMFTIYFTKDPDEDLR